MDNEFSVNIPPDILLRSAALFNDFGTDADMRAMIDMTSEALDAYLRYAKYLARMDSDYQIILPDLQRYVDEFSLFADDWIRDHLHDVDTEESTEEPDDGSSEVE